MSGASLTETDCGEVLHSDAWSTNCWGAAWFMRLVRKSVAARKYMRWPLALTASFKIVHPEQVQKVLVLLADFLWRHENRYSRGSHFWSLCYNCVVILKSKTVFEQVKQSFIPWSTWTSQSHALLQIRIFCEGKNILSQYLSFTLSFLYCNKAGKIEIKNVYQQPFNSVLFFGWLLFIYF